MYHSLSPKQRQILQYNEGCVVVKACPGSGKTFSVASRISRLINEKKFNNTGIAALSFTNVAADEIREKLRRGFNIANSLQYPHFIGTIDKFINTYIFLPYGHLIMDSGKRPELVGSPHRSWTKGKGDRVYRRIPPKWIMACVRANPHGYFDCASFDINDELYPIVPAQEFHFSLKKNSYYNKDGSVNKKIQDVIDAKWENFRLGYATQADANYIAWKVLEKYPLISKCLAQKFDYLIVDEAQDTDAIQMRIIEILQASGAGNIMLIGDRDQSIYEWNNADPTLFDIKCVAWNKIELDENWRSSQRICNFTQPLSTFSRSFAVAPTIDKYDYQPSIYGYNKGDFSSMNPILSEFFATCEQNAININESKVAVLFRGKSMAQYIGNPINKTEFETIPWAADNYHVKDIIRGKLLYELRDFKDGYRLLEKGYFEAINKVNDKSYHCSSDLISLYIERTGFVKHRMNVFQFIDLLPATPNHTINTWVNKANQNLAAAGFQFSFITKPQNSNVLILDLFSKEFIIRNTQPFYSGTIHSVKGRTFDAVLLMLDKRAGTHSNYSTILNNGPKPEEEEELRAVYVGLTRPRKILLLAVPTEDVQVWSKKLYPTVRSVQQKKNVQSQS